MYTFLLILAAIVCVYSLVASLAIIGRQQRKELDKGMNETAVRHPVAANPIVLVYLFFPIAVVIGAILWELVKTE
jgi:hypothetical protein